MPTEAKVSAYGQQGGRIELPVGHHDADGGDDRALKDHGTGDVADRQGVLPLADPDNAVEFLRQLGCNRCDDHGQNEG